MNKKAAEDYLDKLLNSVNDEKVKKEKFKETAKILEDAIRFWEEEGDDLDFNEASYMQTPEKEEKKSKQEDFLDSLLVGVENTEFGMNRKNVNPNPMYSRRVSKSEADFLREFEAELAGEGDDYSDLFGNFEDTEIPKVVPEDRLEKEDIAVHENKTESFTLGGVDLGSLVEESSANGVPADDTLIGEMPMDDVMVDTMGEDPSMGNELPMDELPLDMLDDLFSEDGSLNLASETPVAGATDAIDLGNLGEEDLMNLLAGADGLSDIGDMLSQSEGSTEPMDGVDAFAAFAESEMAAPNVAETAETESVDEKGKKAKKGGLLGKISSVLSNLMKDDEEEEVELKQTSAPTAEMLSGENADILASLESLEEKPSSTKKEKKKKEKKPKKEKAPKKPKAPKVPKPKKEKKPKEVDNTPPLPKGPVIMIWLMVASLFALVMLGVNLTGYSSAIANAKSLHNNGEYAAAFAELDGWTIKEADMELYNQVAVLATVDSELNEYESFSKNDKHEYALDALICAAGRCELNMDKADVYECLGQMEILKKAVSNELENNYNMTYEEAVEMYDSDRDDYTIALAKKLKELGLD